MTQFKTFSLFSLLMIMAIVSGFFAGQRYGHESGLSNWQSLPTETVTYYVGPMLPCEIENLIATINSSVIPEFCKSDPSLLVEAKVHYYNAKRTYFRLKDKFEPRASLHPDFSDSN